MIFNSLTFLIFLCVVVLAYWKMPRQPRLLMLFSASLVFYGFWRWDYIVVMLVSVLIDYYAAAKIDKIENEKHRKFLLLCSLTANLGLLFYFKYTLFLVENVNGAFALFGMDNRLGMPNILLPIGISFYTFQSISYTIDVYRRFIPAQREFLLFANYVVFFPQLVAGPILRAREVFWQLNRRHDFHVNDLIYGVRRIIYGLFLKVVLADNIAPFVDRGFALNSITLSAWDTWVLAFLFGFQIYFDFSAYSHIAIGSARLMGIRFPENFNFPYLAKSPKEFWQRWHISLSSWIRDYLYLPLCGAQVKDVSVGGLAVATEQDAISSRRRTIALLATWAIMGLWHGAAWTFMIWGLWHATMVLAYRVWTMVFRIRLPQQLSWLLGWSVTLPLMMLGWLPFRADNIDETMELFSHVITFTSYFDVNAMLNGYVMAAFPRNLSSDFYLITAGLVFGSALIGLFYSNFLPIIKKNKALWFAIETGVFTVMLSGIIIFLRPIHQFIYFQF